MRRNPARLTEFEDKLIRETVLDVATRFRLFEAMVQEARTVGALPPADPLEGIEVDIRLAKALHVREAAG